MPSIEDKLMTASQIKEVTDTKLDKDFSSLDTSGGFSLTDELAVNISGSPYRITGRTLANAIGGGGTEQAALTNYVKNCGTISSLPATFTDSNITADMIVIEYTVGDESAVGSDWTVTTSDGSFTIAGTLAKSTSLSIVFGVGYSTTPSILTNLASDSPDNILKASPRPGVTGVLPLVNGGVGSSTAAGARTNLDVYSKSETNSAIQQSTAALTTREDLTVTYTQNQYITSSDLGISVRRIGKAYAIDGNLWLSNEFSADSPVEICRIINYNAAKPIRLQIPNGAYTMLLTIYDNGIVAFGRVSSSLSRGWYRFGVTALKYD